MSTEHKAAVIAFPIVITLITPLVLKDASGNVIEEWSEVRIEHEPDFGEYRIIMRCAEGDRLRKSIQLLTNLPEALIDRIKVRDIAQIDAEMATFLTQ